MEKPHVIPMPEPETQSARLQRLQAEAVSLVRQLTEEALRDAQRAAVGLCEASRYPGQSEQMRDRLIRLGEHLAAELLSLEAMRRRAAS